MPSKLAAIRPTSTRWDDFVTHHPQSHVLQLAAWGQLKSRFGWGAEPVALARGEHLVAGAQILYRRLPYRLGSLAYVPKGPLVDWDDEDMVAHLIAALDWAARAQGAFALSLEPDLPDTPENQARLRAAGFAPGARDVQPRRSLLVDLQPDEEEIMAAMKSKTRYNIRLSGRKGVSVRRGRQPQDLEDFNRLLAVTGERGDFGVHDPAYYQAAFELFPPERLALFLAEYEGEVLSALAAFALGVTAWYFWGASSDAHRNLMAPYAVQWAAIQWARSLGCTSYDLWGVPDQDRETLEEQFTQRSDGLWGVYRFKRGFGGQLVRTVGAWDRVYGRLRYGLYRQALRWVA